MCTWRTIKAEYAFMFGVGILGTAIIARVPDALPRRGSLGVVLGSDAALRPGETRRQNHCRDERQL